MSYLTPHYGLNYDTIARTRPSMPQFVNRS
jgi:hypothetical protein